MSMSAQQQQFAETIRAMKLAMKRRADDSDSDDYTRAHTNRGNKLRRRGKFVREGRLNDMGNLSHRKKVNHAGYTRHIIAAKPTLYDEDGDIVSPLDSDDDRSAEPVEEDAFGDVHLEHLLRPLTAAAELPEHPSLRNAYTSKALTQMVEEAAEMVRRERECLWKAKRLLQRFRGDADWVPCETFETEQDEMMLLPNGVGLSAAPSVAVDPSVPPEMEVGGSENGVAAMDMAVQATIEGQEGDAIHTSKVQGEKMDVDDGDGRDTAEQQLLREQEANDPQQPEQSTAIATIERDPTDPTGAAEGSEHTSNSGKETNGTNAPSHSMTTRRGARARSPAPLASPSPTPSDAASIPAIHPWFIPPPTSLPDRDLGLPAAEAEETRRLLLLYVQKQEQIVRSLDTLYAGLQRADRLRNTVFRACKAEGHVRDDGRGNMVTEMSDGEDWYDVEEWGLLRTDLKLGKGGVWGLEKGKDEVDDAEEEGRRGGRRRRVNRM